MPQASKLLLIDKDNNYLLLYRNNHPYYGNDPDIPGGAVEKGETPRDAAMREAEEEIGVKVKEVEEVYAGYDYSVYGTRKNLFMTRVEERPEVKISWEHSGYEWLSREAFLEKIKSAKDTYMHMVYKVLMKQS
jgi:8-oxo-dGTP diphosphatase